jgi:hypothetical protein
MQPEGMRKVSGSLINWHKTCYFTCQRSERL